MSQNNHAALTLNAQPYGQAFDFAATTVETKLALDSFDDPFTHISVLECQVLLNVSRLSYAYRALVKGTGPATSLTAACWWLPKPLIEASTPLLLRRR